MDDQAVQTLEEEPAIELERLWLEQRRRAAEILAQQKSYLDEIDLRLAAQVELISSQVSAASNVSDEQLVEINRQRAELAERQLKIEQDHEKSAFELQQWSDQLRQKQQELERRNEELRLASEKVKQVERSLEAARHAHAAETEQFAQRKARLDEQQRHLDSEQAAIEARRQETKNQRQRIAEELKQQRSKQLEEIERRRAELEAVQQKSRQESELGSAAHQQAQAEADRARAALEEEQRRIAAERSELEELRRRADQDRQELERAQQELKRQQASAEAAGQTGAVASQELARLQEQCERLTAQCAQYQAAAEKHAAQAAVHDQQRTEIQALEQKLRAAYEQAGAAEKQLSELRAAFEALQQEAAEQVASTADATQLATVTAERDSWAAQFAEAREKIGQLEEQLAHAESQAVAAGEAQADDQPLQDLQRRFELALEDVRSLKRRNAELEDQVAGFKAGRGEVVLSGASDWESMKKRMMAELEADSDDTPERKQERISIQNTIRATDELVSDKDREIEELKQLLAQQSDNIGSVAVGAAAVAQIFDQDELIRQERERLQQAQQEWREKLRQAEIDVSLERARIARERVELEEKLRVFEAEKAEQLAAAHGHAHGKGGKPARGRWLERLGLKDGEK